MPSVDCELSEALTTQFYVKDVFTSPAVKLIVERPQFNAEKAIDTDEIRISYGAYQGSGENRIATYAYGELDNYVWPQIVIAPWSSSPYYIMRNSSVAYNAICKVTAEPCNEDGSMCDEYKLTPEQMVQELENMVNKELTGDCSYRLAKVRFDNPEYKNINWSTKDITNIKGMFYGAGCLKELNQQDWTLPEGLKKIYLTKGQGYHNYSYFLFDINYLTETPYLINFTPAPFDVLYYFSINLIAPRQKYLPDDFCDTWDWSKLDNSTGARAWVSPIRNKQYLRTFPIELLNHPKVNANGEWNDYPSYTTWYYMANQCWSLSKLNGLMAPDVELISNYFLYAFVHCYCLSSFTFENDGLPRRYKNQIIDLSGYIGWYDSYYSVYSRGNIYIDSDEKYQAYKENTDPENNYGGNLAYSVYNRASAVETINSLPDCSAYCAEQGATNTIKFKGESGSATDEGAINTMTEEEIAVATEKGWTVSFV